MISPVTAVFDLKRIVCCIKNHPLRLRRSRHQQCGNEHVNDDWSENGLLSHLSLFSIK